MKRLKDHSPLLDRRIHFYRGIVNPKQVAQCTADVFVNIFKMAICDRSGVLNIVFA
jgi:hypothetical protein